MKVIIIDNYDSFTYNIMHYIEQYVNVCNVIKVDELVIDHIETYDKIVFSPGPGLPKDRPILNEIIKQYQGRKPILGICFGHQAIAEYFGSELFNMDEVHHGVSRSTKICTHSTIFKDLPEEIKTGRYHSWAVNSDTLSNDLKVLAIDKEQKTIMALEHKIYDIIGIQFHPESVLTEHGLKMIENWLKS